MILTRRFVVTGGSFRPLRRFFAETSFFNSDRGDEETGRPGTKDDVLAVAPGSDLGGDKGVGDLMNE